MLRHAAALNASALTTIAALAYGNEVGGRKGLEAQLTVGAYWYSTRREPTVVTLSRCRAVSLRSHFFDSGPWTSPSCAFMGVISTKYGRNFDNTL